MQTKYAMTSNHGRYNENMRYDVTCASYLARVCHIKIDIRRKGKIHLTVGH